MLQYLLPHKGVTQQVMIVVMKMEKQLFILQISEHTGAYRSLYINDIL